MKQCLQQTKLLPDASRARREGARCLSESGGRLLLIEAVFLAMMPLAVAVSVESLLQYVLLPSLESHPAAVLWASIGTAVLLCLFFLFFDLPLAVGVFYIASLLERGEAAVLSDVFWAFSSTGAYRRASRLSFGFLWRLALTVLTVCLTYEGFRQLVLAQPMLALLWAFLGGIVIVGELLLAAVLSMGGFPDAWTYLTSEGEERKCRAGGASLPHRFSAGVRFFLGYVPAMLLSVLSVGVLFPVDTLPKMLLSYFRYCRSWNELTIRSEEK